MQIIKKLTSLPRLSRVVMTIGFFDGFHRGHQKLFRLMENISRSQNCQRAVFTFAKHPLWVLSPARAPLSINSEEYKEEFLKERADYLIIPDFTREIADLKPHRFMDLLMEHFGYLELIVGSDFRFGCNNEGHVGLMEAYAKNEPRLKLHVVEPVLHYHHKVSSTYIRQLIQLGKMEEVSYLLKRQFFIENEVLHGEGLGRKIGFPTANLKIPSGQVIPKFGVYSGYGQIKDKAYRALIYVADNKLSQFDEQVFVEANLLDFDSDIYGQKLRVFFSRWHRSPSKISSLEELKHFLEQDKAWLERSGYETWETETEKK